MNKKIIFFVFTLLTLSWCEIIAASEFDAICLDKKNPVDKMVCDLSDKLHVPPEKIGIGMVLASAEITGTYCDFEFTEKFLEIRLDKENDLDVKKVVKFLISFYKDKPPPNFNGDKKVFCKMEYATLKKEIFK